MRSPSWPSSAYRSYPQPFVIAIGQPFQCSKEEASLRNAAPAIRTHAATTTHTPTRRTRRRRRLLSERTVAADDRTESAMSAYCPLWSDTRMRERVRLRGLVEARLRAISG
jgi:hypothetical protein